MKTISKLSNGIFSFVSRQRFLTALILCALFSLIYIASNGFVITSGNDDYCVFKTFLGGDNAVLCLGYFFSSFFALIQPLFGRINAYMVFQEIICFVSIAAVNYFFISKLGAKRGVFYSVVFNTVFLSFIIVDILFTFTAVVSTTAGLLCLFYGSVYEKRKKAKLFQIISGFALVLIGSQLRISPFFVCCGIGLIYALGVLVVYVAKRIKNGGFKKAVFSAIKKYLATGILLAAALVSAFGLNAVSDIIKNSSEDYREMYQYNQAQTSVIDVTVPPFYKNPEKFKEIGLESPEDFETIRTWFIDDEFYTIDRLNKLSEIMRADIDDGINNKSVVEKIIYPFQKTFAKALENGSLFLMLFVFIVALFGVVIVSILFPKLKELLIKLFLLAFLWSLFILISDVFVLESVMLLPLMAVSLIITLRYNLRQAVITLLVIAVLLIPYAYLVSIRLAFRATFSAIYPAFVMIIYGIDRENRIKIQKKPQLKKVALSFAAVLCAAASVYAGMIVFRDQVPDSDVESNVKMAEYVESHPDKVFLLNQIMLTRPYYNPFILPSEKPNLVNYGLWLVKTKYVKNAKAENGIKNIFKDSINSGMLIIIFEKELPDESDTSIINNAYLTKYYNNHYAEDGEVIKLNRVERVGKYSLYEVVSEPATE